MTTFDSDISDTELSSNLYHFPSSFRELADQFAAFLKELWSGEYRSLAPRDFKWKLEKFAPQFAGYQQHDSQELLGYLLDGLHEDLNRVRDKPYVEHKDCEGMADEEAAALAWQWHKMRNDSVIIDWFQGQLKSTVVCPHCARVSITFDPFMYLSVPLPIKSTRDVQVIVMYRDPALKPVKYSLSVAKSGTISDLKQAIQQRTNIPAECQVITELFSGRIFKQYKDNEAIDSINERDTIVR